jgi:hypothetical protein
MHTKLKRLLLLVLTLALLFGAAGQAIPRLHAMRTRYHLSNEPVKGISPQIALATQALAWGRGIIIDVIWIRMEGLKRDGRFFELVQLARWACDLAPRIPEVWDLQAWNMAYNVSCQFDSFADRWAWVWQAVALLRDKGIAANPNSAQLYESLAWTIFHKIGEQDDNAHPYYKQQFAYLMQEVLAGGGDEATLKALAAAPRTREDLLKDADVSRLVTACAALDFDVIDRFFELLHATPSITPQIRALVNQPGNRAAMQKVAVFARSRKLRETYKMDPNLMLALREAYKDDQGRPAPFDWRSPYPHAIYWATVGLQKVDELDSGLRQAAAEFGFKMPTRASRGEGDTYGEEDLYGFQRAELQRIVYYSMQSLVKHGRVLFNIDGQIMLDYGTDYRFADAALPLFEKSIEVLDPRYANTAKDAYRNFLTSAVVQFYFTGDPQQSMKYYKLLSGKFPEAIKPYKNYDDFLQDQFRLYTSSMTYSAGRQLVRAYIYRGLVAMAMNEDDEASALEKEAKTFSKSWSELEDNLRGSIRYDEIRESVIVDFVTGKVGLPPRPLENLKRRLGEENVQRILRNVLGADYKEPVKEKVDEKLLKDQTAKPLQEGPGF